MKSEKTMKDDNSKMMSAEELRALCKMTVELTRLRQNECKNLAIQNFATEMFGKLMCEYLSIVYPSACSDPTPFRELYRHKKTGGIYEVICNATRESDGALMVVYRNTETGDRWVRPADEFGDGRFERVD